MAREAIQAYADGINDYVANIGYGMWYSGHLMPPEFYLFEIDWEPYTVIDALAIMRMCAVYTSLSWPFDISREQIRQYPELEPLVNEILPFRSDYQWNNLVVRDDDSAKMWGQYSEESLAERHKEFEAAGYYE